LRASVSRGAIEPLYFGPSTKPLFGCYYTPLAGLTRDCGVVLGYPMGEEYIRFHRACRELALRLSNVGFPVLRFDFYGCGDSGGRFEQGSTGQWLTDLDTAIGDMRTRCGVTRVCLVGLRLGGTLSIISGSERQDIDGMVLWDPIINGIAHVKELTALHHKMLQYAHVKVKRPMTDGKQVEILGFPLADSLIQDLESIDLLAIRERPANNILVIESNEEVAQEQLARHLRHLGAHVDYQQHPSPQIWVWTEDVIRILVPHPILEATVSWISEMCP
jgi:pimeloyl-ACP methyl ester carboxylesterase